MQHDMTDYGVCRTEVGEWDRIGLPAIRDRLSAVAIERDRLRQLLTIQAAQIDGVSLVIARGFQRKGQLGVVGAVDAAVVANIKTSPGTGRSVANGVTSAVCSASVLIVDAGVPRLVVPTGGERVTVDNVITRGGIASITDRAWARSRS